jgi:hypothetical protein
MRKLSGIADIGGKALAGLGAVVEIFDPEVSKLKYVQNRIVDGISLLGPPGAALGGLYFGAEHLYPHGGFNGMVVDSGRSQADISMRCQCFPAE